MHANGIIANTLLRGTRNGATALSRHVVVEQLRWTDRSLLHLVLRRSWFHLAELCFVSQQLLIECFHLAVHLAAALLHGGGGVIQRRPGHHWLRLAEDTMHR